MTLEALCVETDRIYLEVWRQQISVSEGRRRLEALARQAEPFVPVPHPWFENKVDLR